MEFYLQNFKLMGPNANTLPAVFKAAISKKRPSFPMWAAILIGFSWGGLMSVGFILFYKEKKIRDLWKNKFNSKSI